MDDRLTIDEVRKVVEEISGAFERAYGEPMPPFDTHDAGKLSGALAAPFQSAFGEDIYTTVYLKAAALFYFVAKDHAFENGNKRTAVIVLLYYLAKNGIALQIGAHALYTLAVRVVESERDKDALIKAMAGTLEETCLPLEDWLKRRNERVHEHKDQ
ncbi:MAG: Death-on-curing protein [Patescibacteria group bacterium]|nr:Death-on-curing protein [Patescibacteria group bacterium]